MASKTYKLALVPPTAYEGWLNEHPGITIASVVLSNGTVDGRPSNLFFVTYLPA